MVTGHLAPCLQTSKQTSFEQLIDVDYFTLVRTTSLPRLPYSSLLLFGGEVTSLGGEVASWWRVGWWRNRVPGGEMTGYLRNTCNRVRSSGSKLHYFQYFVLVEGVAEEEEVDDQLLWNLQILSEVRMYLFYTLALHRHLHEIECLHGSPGEEVLFDRPKRTCSCCYLFVNRTFLTKKNDCDDMTNRIISP